MHTSDTDKPRARVVNLISETVTGEHGHGVHTAFLQTKRALEQAGADVRVNAGAGCDIVHLHTIGPRSLWTWWRTKERAVVTAHVVPESFVGSFILAPVWLPISAFYLRMCYSVGDEIIAVGPSVVQGLKRLRLKAPVRCVPNAIDIERFRPQPGWREQMRTKLGIAQDAFVVVCPGQIQPRKGVDDFVDAARQMPNTEFVWVGGRPFGRLTAGYEPTRQAVETAPANCHFIGEVPYEEMPPLMAASDCLFFPSRQETFGLVIVEAAAAGLPIVLRDLDSYHGLFDGAYLAGDTGSFVESLKALRHDEAVRADYVARALEMAERFDTLHHGQMLLQAYDEVLARPESERAAPARRLRPGR
jgi:1,2-diacylglycerol-3-alpha-glucose alpha-1,2-galactosyltransferase